MRDFTVLGHTKEVLFALAGQQAAEKYVHKWQWGHPYLEAPQISNYLQSVGPPETSQVLGQAHQTLYGTV